MLDVEESMLDVAQASRDELKTAYSRVRRTGASCDDLDDAPGVDTVEQEPPCARPASTAGTRWVSLRQCLDCGNVGCCDSSVGSTPPRTSAETDAPRDAVGRAAARTGAGASCTTSRLEPRRRRGQAGGRSSAGGLGGGSVGAVGSAGSAGSAGSVGSAGSGGSGGTGGTAGTGGTGGRRGRGRRWCRRGRRGRRRERRARIRRRRRDRRGLRNRRRGRRWGRWRGHQPERRSLPACSIPQMPETSRCRSASSIGRLVAMR